MARKGYRTVEISRDEALMLAAWVRLTISRYSPTLLSNGDHQQYAASWTPTLKCLDRVGVRRAIGFPRLPVAIIYKLVAHLDAISISRSAPPAVLRALIRIKAATRPRGRQPYRTSAQWRMAAQRTIEMNNDDYLNLVGKQKRNAKRIGAWEARFALGETLLTISSPLPLAVIPRSRKNRPI